MPDQRSKSDAKSDTSKTQKKGAKGNRSPSDHAYVQQNRAEINAKKRAVRIEKALKKKASRLLTRTPKGAARAKRRQVMTIQE